MPQLIRIPLLLAAFSLVALPAVAQGDAPVMTISLSGSVSEAVPDPRAQGTANLPLIATGHYVFVVNESGRRLTALMAGDTDLAFDFPEIDFARRGRDRAGGLQLFRAPTARLFFMSANLQGSPSSDSAIREAVSLAIDRHMLVEIATVGGGAVPPRTIFPFDEARVA